VKRLKNGETFSYEVYVTFLVDRWCC